MAEMGPIPGSHAFAFIVMDFIAAWAHRTDSFLVTQPASITGFHCTRLIRIHSQYK